MRLVTPTAAEIGSIRKGLLAASAAGFGMLAYSAFVWRLTGHAFAWAEQNAAWGRTYLPIDALVAEPAAFISDHGVYQFARDQPTNALYWAAIALVLISIWPVYRRLGLPYAVLIVGTILPPMAMGGLLSIGRITSVLFPVFMWLGLAVPAAHRQAWVGFFALLQGFVAVMFFTWRLLY